MSRIFKRPESPNWYYTTGSKSSRKRSTGTANKRVAKFIQDKWDEERILLKHNIISYKISLHGASKKYIGLLEGKIGASYLRKIKFVTNFFIKNNPNKEMHEITVNDIDQFIKDRKGLSPKTIIDNVSIFRKWFDWGKVHKYTAENPADGAILPPLEKVVFRKDLDLKAVKKAISNTSRKDDKTYWAILFYTGLRAMDGGRLTKDQISKGKDGKPVIDMIQGKTKRRVIIPLNKSLIGKNIYNVMGTEAKSNKSRVRLKEFIPESDLHSLRHTFASRLIELGATTFEVKALLGHQSNDVTMDYIHHNIAKLRELVNGF